MRVFISFTLLIPTFALLVPPADLAVHLHRHRERSATRNALKGINLRLRCHTLAPVNFRRGITRPVSYYALFKGMAASKPTSWLFQ